MAIPNGIDTSREGLLFIFGRNLYGFIQEAGIEPTTPEGKKRCLDTINRFSEYFADLVERIIKDTKDVV